MNVEQCWSSEAGSWLPREPGGLGERANLVLVFGSTGRLRDMDIAGLRPRYPKALIVGCSTAGEIHETRVSDESIVLTAVAFEHTRLQGTHIRMDEKGLDSRAAGMRLGSALEARGLAHVLVLSDGLRVNGSELVEGLLSVLPRGVTVTGGLSGDGAQFKSTLVILNDQPEEGAVVAVGFYGDRLSVGYGSLGGWDPFGPERLVTRSKGNVLYELDGKSALELYKRYLGDYAADLPASGLLFPLLLRTGADDPGVVRTILAIDEKEQSMTFAGDMPQGSYARLMRANFDRLIDGATGAARISRESLRERPAELALLISCVGRKLVLKQRTEEEVEAVRDVLGGKPVFTGFYSYGEISPLMPGVKCDLHNQTMTITTFAEI
jgi:hypothetical protein